MEQAREYVGRIMALAGVEEWHWRVKVLGKGLPHLRTSATRYRTTSLLERFNREMRRRDRMGTVWTIHNLLDLL